MTSVAEELPQERETAASRISMPSTVTDLPVGSTPMSSPRCVPVKVQRCATLSPTEITSSCSKRMSDDLV